MAFKFASLVSKLSEGGSSVRYLFSSVVTTFLLLLGPVFAAQAQANVPVNVAADRQEYIDAVRAINRGKWTEYEQLRPGLDDYPLAMYLDYNQLSREAHKVRPAEVRRFISLNDDSPLPNRLLGTYLRQAGKDRRWKDFLAVMSEEPNSIDLKCYYFRAKLAAGDTLAAWEGAERL